MPGSVSLPLPDYLWRYVKPSGHNGLVALPNSYDLRPLQTPPETSVSFWDGCSSDVEANIRNVIGYLADRKFELKKNGRILSLCMATVEKQVNQPVKVVEFEAQGHPHYGMSYVVEDEWLVHEAKSMLADLSQLHSYSGLLK